MSTSRNCFVNSTITPALGLGQAVVVAAVGSDDADRDRGRCQCDRGGAGEGLLDVSDVLNDGNMA